MLNALPDRFDVEKLLTSRLYNGHDLIGQLSK